ncbi:nitrile hydratase subunit beta [Burkholderia sp. FXe9]|nr:nitrile hydratase subunit beta [Burkholderia sp. FXe9]
MDGFHDLGGFQGFGPVPHTINSLGYKPVFKEDWEHLAYSLMFVGVDQLKNSASTRYVTQSNASTCASTSARATTSAT